MKRLLILALFALSLAACKKGPANGPTPAGNSITGKWTIQSVTVIPLDPTKKAMNAGTVYTEPPYYYFQFNADNSWVEVLDPAPNANLGESGSYVLHADTSFTLTNVNLPASPTECKIVSVSGTAFTFSSQRPTLYNGVTPGYLEYIFDLKK